MKQVGFTRREFSSCSGEETEIGNRAFRLSDPGEFAVSFVEYVLNMGMCQHRHVPCSLKIGKKNRWENRPGETFQSPDRSARFYTAKIRSGKLREPHPLLDLHFRQISLQHERKTQVDQKNRKFARFSILRTEKSQQRTHESRGPKVRKSFTRFSFSVRSRELAADNQRRAERLSGGKLTMHRHHMGPRGEKLSCWSFLVRIQTVKAWYCVLSVCCRVLSACVQYVWCVDCCVCVVACGVCVCVVWRVHGVCVWHVHGA